MRRCVLVGLASAFLGLVMALGMVGAYLAAGWAATKLCYCAGG
jgi:hypothetical protein